MVAASELLHYPAVTVVRNVENYPDINIRLIVKFAHSRHHDKKRPRAFFVEILKKSLKNIISVYACQ